jgi:ABC-type lipoprotein release transport system permease subunit
MSSLAWWLSWCYLTQTMYEKSLSWVSIICFAAMAIGAFSIALIMAITRGFEHATKKTIQNIHAPLIVRGIAGDISRKKIAKMLGGIAHIKQWSPTASQYGIVIQENQEQQPYLIVCQGIDPSRHAQVTALGQMLVYPHKGAVLSDVVHDHYIVIGKTMADALAVGVGDALICAFPKENQTSQKNIALQEYTFIINGVFKTGIEDIDANTIFCALDFFDELFPEVGIQEIHIDPTDAVFLRQVKRQLSENSLDAILWHDLYPALMSALTLERYAACAILFLIMLVASMNIVALLFMHINRKTGDIAILRAMGYSVRGVKNIFIIMGMMLSACATTAGLVGAVLCSFCLNHFKLISLPDAYYIGYLPAEMEGMTIVGIFGAMMLVSLIAALLPTGNIGRMNIAQMLRFEG